MNGIRYLNETQSPISQHPQKCYKKVLYYGFPFLIGCWLNIVHYPPLTPQIFLKITSEILCITRPAVSGKELFLGLKKYMNYYNHH